MTESDVPVAGSLSAKIIRACPTHEHCPLDCKFRQVEDLGEVARFDMRQKLSWWQQIRRKEVN